jgi:uncharacterized membrane protein YhaH (DUF805 family)
MDFAEAVKAVFNKYAVFSGRSLRSEFWYWELFGILASIVLSIVDSALFNSNFGGNGPLGALFGLATVVPSLAVGARRLHDTNKSGWWQLLAVTVVGLIPLIIWFCQPGTPGKNNYGGPAPKTV